MRQLALVLVMFGGLAGCGDEGTAVDMAMDDLAMPDLNMQDMTTPPDFAGVTCGTMTCGTTQECCAMVAGTSFDATCVPKGTCGGTDGSTATTIQCDGPEDCPGMMAASGGCCVSITGSIGNADAGSASGGSGSTMCESACPGSVTLDQNTSSFSAHTKLCHAKADCKGYTGSLLGVPNQNFDSCCSSTQVPYFFCMSSLGGQQAGLDCSH